jgi:hypothetical protein
MDPERFRNKQPINNLRTTPLDVLSPPPPPHYGTPKKIKKSKWWVGVVLLVIVVLGLGVWAYMSYKHSVKKVAVARSVAVKPKSAASTSVAPTIPSTSQTSPAYGLTFSYPTSWTVINSGSAPMLVTSPVIKLISDTGQTVSGQIVMTVSKAGLLPAGFTSSSVAVLTSQKIAYTQPSPVQAAATYVSFVQYPATNISGGLDGIYVSGNYGYQKYQVIPVSNINQTSPLVDFSFYSCAGSTCPLSTRRPLTVSINEWNSASFKDPIMLILKSFSFS